MSFCTQQVYLYYKLCEWIHVVIVDMGVLHAFNVTECTEVNNDKVNDNRRPQ